MSKNQVSLPGRLRVALAAFESSHGWCEARRSPMFPFSPIEHGSAVGPRDKLTHRIWDLFPRTSSPWPLHPVRLGGDSKFCSLSTS